MKDEQVINIGAIVQAELDKRIDLLHQHVEFMPFGGHTVLKWGDVRILTENFVRDIQEKVRKLK